MITKQIPTMIKKFLFDASAVLAILLEENIKIDLNQYLKNSVINAVNASEVLAVLQNRGMNKEMACSVLESTIAQVIPVSFKESLLAAEVKVTNRHLGISTGDSFCLASGMILGHSIITADKIWASLKIEEINIILIR